jgi:DNA-binding MarR family transcriptional regulator
MKKRPVYSDEKQAQFERFVEFNEKNLARIMRQVNRMVNTEFTHFMTEKGFKNLTSRHLNVFDNIELTGTNIITLARRAYITKQAMSKLVKEMHAAELVWTVVNPDDTRVLWVFPTNKAIELMEEYKDLMEDKNAKKESTIQFSSEQYETSFKFLNDLLKSYSTKASNVVLESVEA